MWSKKWYLKRNISCDAHLLNGVPWDDAIVVSAGKLRKLWDSLSELRSFLCESGLERTVLRPALLPVKTAQFTQFIRQVWRHTVQSLSLTESVQGALQDRAATATCKMKTHTCWRRLSWRSSPLLGITLKTNAWCKVKIVKKYRKSKRRVKVTILV